jgi:hypothetical protein
MSIADAARPAGRTISLDLDNREHLAPLHGRSVVGPIADGRPADRLGRRLFELDRHVAPPCFSFPASAPPARRLPG